VEFVSVKVYKFWCHCSVFMSYFYITVWLPGSCPTVSWQYWPEVVLKHLKPVSVLCFAIWPFVVWEMPLQFRELKSLSHIWWRSNSSQIPLWFLWLGTVVSTSISFWISIDKRYFNRHSLDIFLQIFLLVFFLANHYADFPN
jgi:hypothetical protein